MCLSPTREQGIRNSALFQIVLLNTLVVVTAQLETPLQSLLLLVLYFLLLLCRTWEVGLFQALLDVKVIVIVILNVRVL